MTLKEFTENSLVEITEGIVAANQRLSDYGAFVVSTNVKDCSGNSSTELLGALDDENKEHLVTKVDFDICVTVSDSNLNGIGGSVELSVLSIGLGKNAKTQNANVNRVKFSIPLALPIIECQQSCLH